MEARAAVGALIVARIGPIRKRWLMASQDILYDQLTWILETNW